MPTAREVTIEGVLTTNLGALESARTGFIQDATGGIAIYLDAAFGDPIPAGMRARVTGTIDSRFAQRTIRVDRADVMVLGPESLPAVLSVPTGEASEPLEGLRLELTGTVTETPSQLSDGLGITIDDGSGPVRVVAGPDALGTATPVKGSIIVARGPLGQRDSSGTGLEGYRLNATMAGELEVSAPATPSPSPTAPRRRRPRRDRPPTPTPTPVRRPRRRRRPFRRPRPLRPRFRHPAPAHPQPRRRPRRRRPPRPAPRTRMP